jgi:hypothetical protein
MTGCDRLNEWSKLLFDSSTASDDLTGGVMIQHSPVMIQRWGVFLEQSATIDSTLSSDDSMGESVP